MMVTVQEFLVTVQEFRSNLNKYLAIAKIEPVIILLDD